MKVHFRRRTPELVIRTRRGIRFLLKTQQRSAGRHLFGPVYMQTEWHNYDGVRYFNLTIGNPTVHHRWAFQVWLYFTL